MSNLKQSLGAFDVAYISEAYISAFVEYKKRRRGMIASETTLFNRINNTEINIYRSPYGQQPTPNSRNVISVSCIHAFSVSYINAFYLANLHALGVVYFSAFNEVSWIYQT